MGACWGPGAVWSLAFYYSLHPSRLNTPNCQNYIDNHILSLIWAWPNFHLKNSVKLCSNSLSGKAFPVSTWTPCTKSGPWLVLQFDVGVQLRDLTPTSSHTSGMKRIVKWWRQPLLLEVEITNIYLRTVLGSHLQHVSAHWLNHQYKR